MRELHGRSSTAGAHRTQLGYVPEHFAQRHLRLDHLQVGTAVHAFQDAAATVKVTRHVSHILIGGQHFHFHDRLKQNGLRLASAFTETGPGTYFKAHGVGIHIMIAAVEHPDLHILHRISGKYAGNHGYLKTLRNGRDEFLGDTAPVDIIHELEGLAFILFQPFRVCRPDRELDVGELTTTARLFLQYLAMFDRRVKGFLISYLGRALVDLYFEFTAHTVDDDLQVQFTHAPQDGLTGFFIGIHAQGGIFFHQLGDRHAHLIHVHLRFRFHRDGDNRLGDEHIFQRDGMILIAQRIPGLNFLESNGRPDITRLDEIDGILFVGEHLQDTADTLFLSTSYIQYIRAGIEMTAITAEEGQPTDERIGHDLEGQGAERLLGIGLAGLRFAGIRIDTCRVFNIQGRRQITAYGVERCLHAFILERRTAHHRHDAQIDRCLADGFMHFIFG